MKTTLLVDMNNLVSRCIYATPVIAEKELDIKYQLWKYIIFESLLGTIRKFKPQEIILCVDSPNSWRKDIYPIYKQNRTEKREEDDFDWERFYNEYNAYLEELKILPFNILKVPRTEADDIIGVLAIYLQNTNVIIISTDRDYKQLLDIQNCRLYNPIKKEFIELETTAEDFLLHEILNGQGKDNVGNIITPVDWDKDKRKPPMGDKKIQKIFSEGIDEWLDYNHIPMKTKYNVDIKERFDQNTKILDLRLIPKEYKEYILAQYKEYESPDLENMYSFFKKQQWPSILENYNYVENLLIGVC